jgi:hypothetical protein
MTPRPLSPCASRRFTPLLAALLALALLAAGCGSSGSIESSGGSGPPPSPDFSLLVSPLSVVIPDGGSAIVSLSATGLDGFSSQITVQVSGLSPGVSISPMPITLVPGTPQLITISAPGGNTSATETAVFAGTAGSLSHSANLSVQLQPASADVAPFRTKYVRTDTVTEYFSWLNTHWTIFHQPTGHFFVTDPTGNKVVALDPATESKVGSIPVPGAFGIDDTPDHGTLYVGTLAGDVYTIDPVAMAVTHRYIASEIGPYGYRAFSAQVMADGRVALLGAQGGIPSVDGSPSFAIWNPVDNSIVIYASGYGSVQFGSGIPVNGVCGPMLNIGGFTRTADRKAVLVGSIDSDVTLCEVNEATGQYTYAQALGTFSTNKIISSPDGSLIALTAYPSDVVLYDGHTLQVVAQFAVAGDTSSAAGLFFSADSRTLFVPSETIVYAYDVATHQQVGWMPNLVVEPISGGSAVGPISGPNFGAEDTSGLIAGPMEEGFGFIDTTAMRTGAVGTQFANLYLNPATGPASGGTQVMVPAPLMVNAQSKIYFGKNTATSLTPDGAYNIFATTPPGTPGPVDVYVLANDGGMQIAPEGFNYGPTILQVSPDLTTADGGAIGVVFGYGYGPTSATTAPSDLKVTVGGKPATILGFNALGNNTSSPPNLMQAIYYTVPAASAGPADVTVTTSSGTTTAPGALRYRPSASQFSLPGSQLAQGIYDPVRDLYYFTDTNKIQVFSLSQQKWLSPIAIAAPTGKTQRLWSLALSPSGSHLAVSDISAGVIYLLNPSSPTSIQTFPILVQNPGGGIIDNPAGLAVSDSGNAYYTVFVQGGTGFSAFFKLDTNTGTFTDYKIDGPQYYIDVNGVPVPQDPYLRTEISSDNARVFFNNDGEVFNIDTAADKVFQASTDVSCCYGNYDLALSSDQTQFGASASLYDSNLNEESNLTLNDREITSISYVYGTKLSPDGSLFFQPSTSGIDIFDGHLGTLRNRLALPFLLSQNYDALVGNGKDNVLLAITGATGNGIAVLDLSFLAEPAPLSYNSAGISPPLLSLASSPAFERAAGVHQGSASPRANANVASVRAIPHATNRAYLGQK